VDLFNSVKDSLEIFFKEDALGKNIFYEASLPTDEVECFLKFKSDMVIAGTPFFVSAFKYLGFACEQLHGLQELEGREVVVDHQFQYTFTAPFMITLTAERVALNLLQHCSSIATYTNKFVEKAKKYNIEILDTRKTTPGLRAFEKYAVRIGNGKNHRMDSTDVWMVKDNHKSFFGGLKEAVEFFKKQGAFYNSTVVEIHNLIELKEAFELGVRYCMLDNFKPEQIVEAVKIKPKNVTYEVSGGIRLDNLDSYLIQGVDAISVGAITNNAPKVDISLKFFRTK